MQEISSKYVDEIRRFLRLENMSLKSDSVPENVKELCVARLSRVIGITFAYDYKNEYFRLFSNIVGEAVCRHLGIKLTVGSPVVRLFRYNGINLVEKAKDILDRFELEEAFLELYEFVEGYREIVPKF